MNIYRRELRFMRSSVLIWAFALCLVMLMFISIYPAFSRDIDTSKQLLEQFPPQIRQMLGISLSAFFTFIGFYAYTFTYATLAGAVQAMILGVNMVTKEDIAKTSDFLLSKPVSRSKVFIGKLAAVLTALLTTWLLFTGGTYLLAIVFGVGEIDVQKFLAMAGAFFMVQLWFMAFGILLSRLIKKVKSVVSLSLSCVFGFFIVGLIGALLDDEKIRLISPLKYFRYMDYVVNGSFEAKYLGLAAVSIAVMLVVAYIIYIKKDVRSAL